MTLLSYSYQITTTNCCDFLQSNSTISRVSCDPQAVFSGTPSPLNTGTSLPNRSKLTRESGTDFPIPAIPGVADNETEKLIREKDEEVRHADHVADSHQHHEADHESERLCDHPVHSEPPAYPESPPDLIGDTAL